MSNPQLVTSLSHKFSSLRASPVSVPESESETSVENSFLNETSFNSDIDLVVRFEIEKKFKHSVMNSQYKFPRITPNSDSNSHLKPIYKFQKTNSRPYKHKLFDKSLPYITKQNSSYHQAATSKASLANVPQFWKLDSAIHDRYNQHPQTKRSKKECNTVRNTSIPQKPKHVRWKSDAMMCSKVKLSPYFHDKGMTPSVQSSL
jgi:hypothetical protein